MIRRDLAVDGAEAIGQSLASDDSHDQPELRTYTEAARPYLDRLERLARTFVGGKFNAAQEIWQLQLDLLQLQREVQKQIGEAKKKLKTDKAARANLGSFRVLRAQARRLGDAIAWTILDGDRKVISSLAENKQVPPGEGDHGSRGMIAIAQALSNEGWGFPLLHDITDFLRIGDVTFVRKGKEPRTVEVKTHLVDSKSTTDGKTKFSYNITVLSAHDFREDMQKFDSKPPEEPEGAVRHLLTPSPRIGRQLRRMGMARAHQEAPNGVLQNFDGEALLSTEVSSPESGHWGIVSRLVERAYKEGYASGSADGSFLYGVFYDPQGLPEGNVLESPLLQDLQRSGILFEDGSTQNVVSLGSIPQREEKAPQLYLPYFLYALHEDAVIDMLFGRLLIVIVVNRGRVVEALEGAGYQVTFSPEGANLSNGSIGIWSGATGGAGGVKAVGLDSIEPYLDELIYEFRPLRHLVDVMTQLCAAVSIAIRDLGSKGSH